MAKSIYVVMEQNFEYTDEYYYSTNGGDPVRAFLTKEEANAEAARLDEDYIAKSDARSLGEHFIGVEEERWDDCMNAAAGDLTTRLAFAEEIGFSGHYVVEVKVEPNATLPEANDFEFDE